MPFVLISLAYTQSDTEKPTIINGFKIVKVTSQTARVETAKRGYLKIEQGKFSISSDHKIQQITSPHTVLSAEFSQIIT